MDGRKSLYEEIVQRLTDLFRRSPENSPPPESDSAIETRREAGDGMSMSFGGSYSWYEDQIRLERERRSKYKEYDRLDSETVEIASALDIYSDNATSGDRDENESIEIVSESDLVIEILNEVKSRLRLDFELWSIAREMVKFGDCFEEIVAYDDGEVHRLKHLEPKNMNVTEDEYGRRDAEFPYAQTDDAGNVQVRFHDWQMLHFKMEKDRTSQYGVDGSLLYPIRKIAKQLSMIEDSLVIARLTRAQQRFAFMIDVNGIEAGQPTIDYLKETKDMMKKKRTIDPMTGKMDLKYNPMSAEEDVFVARREAGGADVKVLQGASNLSQMADVEYFSKKLFAGLKVPKAWMGFEGDTHARAVITELDVQFAKTVRRVQQALIAGLRKLFDIVLLTRGIEPSSVEYTVKLPIMSAIDELRVWQMEVVKATVAQMYKNQLGISSEWVYRHLLELTDEDIEEIKNSIDDEDSLDNMRTQKAVDYASMLNPQPVSAGDAGDAGAEGEGNQAGAAQESHLLPREIRLLRYQLGEELNGLYDLLDWEYETRTGKKLSRRSRSRKVG